MEKDEEQEKLMIGLILTGHANFATGLTSSVHLIAGEQEAFESVDFPPSYSTEKLAEDLTQALDRLKDCEGIIVFTDLMGGSPFNVTAQLTREMENVRVISGTNLPMLVDIVLSRKFMDDLDMLVDSVLETGREQVMKYEYKPVEQNESEDGI